MSDRRVEGIVVIEYIHVILVVHNIHIDLHSLYVVGEVGKQSPNINRDFTRCRLREIVRNQSVQYLGIEFSDCSLIHFELISYDHLCKHRDWCNVRFIISLFRNIVNRQKVKILQSANKEVLTLFVVIRP